MPRRSEPLRPDRRPAALPRAARIAVVLAVVAALARAQSPAAAPAPKLADELAFATELARHRYFDLAADQLARIEATSLPQADREACLEVRALVEALGGQLEATAAARVAHLRRAIACYAELLARTGATADESDRARAGLAACQRQLANLLAGSEAEAAFRAAIEQQEALHRARLVRGGARSDAPLAAKCDAFEPLCDQAATLCEWAALRPEGDPARRDLFERALERATAWERALGHETLRSFDVRFVAGLALVGLDRGDEALARFESIADERTGVAAVIDGDASLAPATVAALARLFERSCLELARLHRRAARLAAVEELRARADAFEANHAARGARRSEAGELLRIEVAGARLDGGHAGAIALLADVARRNAGLPVGALAEARIADAIGRGALADGDRGAIPPRAWMAAGDAASGRERPADAIDRFRDALAALPRVADPEERVALGVRCWSAIGASCNALARHGEAATAFQQGLALAATAKERDEEAIERLASAWHQALAARFKETRRDADRRAKDDALRRLADLGVRDLAWLVAKDDFEEARAIAEEHRDERRRAFAACERRLVAIGEEGLHPDRARILAARCHGEQGDLERAEWEAALRALDAFDARCAAGPPPADRARLVDRDVARMESAWYRSEWLLGLGRHEELLRLLADFERDFPLQKDFFPEVAYRRLMALLALRRLPEAEALFADVTRRIESGAQKPWRDAAAYHLARACLETASDESATPENSADERAAARRRALLAKGAELLAGYCRATGWRSFNNLRVVADSFARLGEWPRAEEEYRRLATLFADAPQHRETLEGDVKRSLAETLLRQRKLAEAAPLYRELAPRFARDPAFLRDAALCHGGWVDVVAGETVEVAGGGDLRSAVDGWTTLLEKGFKPADEGTPRWFEALFFAIWTRGRGRDLDPTWLPRARELLAQLDATTWRTLEAQPGFVARLGGPDWLRRWDHLREQLRER
jgi:hypothetical protein